MKTQLNPSIFSRGSEKSRDRIAPRTYQTPITSPPERHISWLSSYDEEWTTFVSEHLIHKTRPGIHNDEPEVLPRVWNCPHS